VINALSNLYHPCQALADVQTIKERFGRWEGLKLAFVGDGNNVAHSLMLTAGRLGIHVAVATPKGYEPKPQVVAAASAAVNKGGRISVSNDPLEAVDGAHVIYTDVWASMGHEGEKDARLQAFPPYRVDEALMSKARPEAIFMHCLPAKRGEETTDAVIESARSAVFDQAENRLHAQKGLLLTLLK
jgi:ornithine carbamoyltransferase